ncbi:uncharacterized protein [Haliotis cracherodii]|uniref:uncharacterized protein isoform X2 n=1 Tax=Haliotis cracherodii TaxID=6455 RepID=UPI0039E8A4C0
MQVRRIHHNPQGSSQLHSGRNRTMDMSYGIIASISVFGDFQELLLLKIVTTASHTTNMITMENMMLILLLITTSTCSNATQICVERNLTLCLSQNDDGRCTLCHNGYYGPTCSSKCIGECEYDCDMDTGFCKQCKDTYYTESCMVKCSDTCGGQLCDRNTGKCTNGCKKGHCSDFCKTPCDESCKDKECDFVSCKCQRCNDGYVCNEAAKGGNCTQCVTNTSDVQLPTTNHCPPGRCGPSCSPKAGCDKQCGKNCKNGCNFDCTCDECNAGFFGQFCDCKKCNTIALVMMILAIGYIVGVHIKRMIRTWKHASMERTSESKSGREETARLSEGSDSPLELQQIDHGEFPNAYSLTGINGTHRYIMTQMPSTREGDDTFLRMIWKYHIKVIVFISSRQSRVLDGYLNSHNQNSLVLTHEELNHSTWKLVLSENDLPKIAHLYHDPTWFDKQGFCQFIRRVRKDKDFNMGPIVVCSSEGDGPSAVYCALDCMLDKKPSGGINLDECVKRLARQRIRMVSQKKNIQRLRKCWDYVSQSDQTQFRIPRSRIPRSCIMYTSVLISIIAIIVIIIGIIIILRDCYA